MVTRYMQLYVERIASRTDCIVCECVRERERARARVCVCVCVVVVLVFTFCFSGAFNFQSSSRLKRHVLIMISGFIREINWWLNIYRNKATLRRH